MHLRCEEKCCDYRRRGALLLAGLVPALWGANALAADKGALTLEGGPAVWLGSVAPSIGSGDSVTGTLGGARLGVRYALTNHLEVQIGGVWEEHATFVHEPVTVGSGDGRVSGALTEDVSRWGASGGVRYALTGLVWRVPVGFDLGWAHTRATNRDLLKTSDPQAVTSFGLGLRDESSEQLSLAPFIGLEWLAGDRLSFSIVPRLELLVGGHSTVGVVVPFSVGWSLYP